MLIHTWICVHTIWLMDKYFCNFCIWIVFQAFMDISPNSYFLGFLLIILIHCVEFYPQRIVVSSSQLCFTVWGLCVGIRKCDQKQIETSFYFSHLAANILVSWRQHESKIIPKLVETYSKGPKDPLSSMTACSVCFQVIQHVS